MPEAGLNCIACLRKETKTPQCPAALISTGGLKERSGERATIMEAKLLAQHQIRDGWNWVGFSLKETVKKGGAGFLRSLLCVRTGGQHCRPLALPACCTAYRQCQKGRMWIMRSFHILTPCQRICHLDIGSHTQPVCEGRAGAASVAERRGTTAS